MICFRQWQSIVMDWIHLNISESYLSTPMEQLLISFMVMHLVSLHSTGLL